ncbi:c-type cytochrome biogenesis protein CcmI [Hyphomicrobium sp. CS1GBMeth3]|uniref:c-type cytochrome biogenesis protein CcmI n=1 Tax=Hyphomicrobium sp. CS1GBMeth3 TaxID=1892845 RepID=UPI000931DE15|nr:c-type cytochrome biogenesis protein CcmI [Hyphomicrobium sp. CS1GBMeth3]
MLLWLCFAFLTAAIVALLLRPLREAPGQVIEPASADLAVYRDQLRELEAERERGLFVDSEIESARAEIARRLLKRAGANTAAIPGKDDAASRTRARRAYTAVTALLPVVGIGLYVLEGSPHLPDRPFAERQAAAQAEGDASIADLIGRVEQRLREHPEDGKGWDVIAPVYLRLQRYADAAHAFAEANRLEGESVRRLLGFAEATLLAENGVVTEPVRRAALRVLELDPERFQVGVWLALAKEQDGDLEGAAAQYREIYDKAPENVPWRKVVAERLAMVEKKIKGEPVEEEPSAPQASKPEVSPSAPAPTAPAADAPDVSSMSPAEREAFINSMVERLAARLQENGKDLDGWIRLARAYKVLGREDEARKAIASARENFAGDAAPLAEIEKSAETLGLKAEEPRNPQ